MSRNAYWTPEREADLARLWAEDRSAADIARALGGITRPAVIGKIGRMGLRRAADGSVHVPKPMKVCAVPGCGLGLARDNSAGVCRTHMHFTGHCGCVHCGADRAKPARVVRADVRVAHVPYPTSNSGVALSMPVSLPREPWLAGGVA